MTYFDLPIDELLKIKVITTNKSDEYLTETPATINILTEKEIELLNFNSLKEILEYAGLSSINGEGNFFTTTTIRGNTLVNYNTNTLLLIDGVPLTNPYHGSFDLQAIPVSSIKRLEIVKGSNSVLYGSNAINGVINVITKSSADEKLKASGKVNYGSFNTIYLGTAISKTTNDFQFNIFTDILSSSGEELSYNDELGNTLSFNKKYKGLSLVSNLKYKDLKLHIQYYNRAEPIVRTREFQHYFLTPPDTA